MKKLIFLSFIACLLSLNANAFVGTYQTIDDSLNKPKSIVQLYTYKTADGERLAGRIIALYDINTGKISETLKHPKRVAEKVDGKPKMAGLDILWNMALDDDGEYSGGHIMDPKNGNVYRSVIWQEANEPNKIHVRGKIAFIGRTQIWNVMKTSDLPKEIQNLNASKWEPKINED